MPYSAHQMYALVNDCERYPEFLPWCRDARVEWRSDSELEASLEVYKGGFQRWFTTLNTVVPDASIDLKLVHGPFHHLGGHWRFTPLREDACKVALSLEFEFSNAMLSMMFGPVFHEVCNSLVDAFTRRAEDVYGKR